MYTIKDENPFLDDTAGLKMMTSAKPDRQFESFFEARGAAIDRSFAYGVCPAVAVYSPKGEYLGRALAGSWQ